MSTLSERSFQEGTRNVVFLFQSRQLRINSVPFGWEWGDECLYKEREDGEPEEDENGDEIEREQMSVKECWEAGHTNSDGCPCVIESWLTESVWLTREDAHAFGERRSYRWPDGWRVYGVNADDSLADAIRKAEGMVTT